MKEELKRINRDILKCAKKGELYYYWDISNINPLIVKSIISELESDGKFINSKGVKYKVIRW